MKLEQSAGFVCQIGSPESGHCSLVICSGCTDIDDALHCIKLDNGNFEVRTHVVWQSSLQYIGMVHDTLP